jgi:hypothetical protein
MRNRSSRNGNNTNKTRFKSVKILKNVLGRSIREEMKEVVRR